MGRISWAGFGLVALGLSLVACSDDESPAEEGGSGGETSSGGSSGDGGSKSETGGSSSDGGASASGGASGSGGSKSSGGSGGKGTTPGACEAPEPTVVLDGVMLDQLSAVDGGVVFIDRTKGVRWVRQEMGGAVRRIAGEDDDLLVETGENELLVALISHGDHAYYLHATYIKALDPAPVRLFRVPLAGGPPELLSEDLPDLAPPTTQLAGADDEFVYVNYGNVGLYRVAIDGGAVERVSEQRILHNAWLLDDGNIYFSHADAGPSQPRLAVLPKTATDGTGTDLITSGCTAPYIANSGLWCVNGNPFSQKINRYDLEGANMTEIAAFDEGRGGNIAADDADFVYYVISDLPTLDGHPIYKIPVDGGAPVMLACDRHEFAIFDTDGLYPTSRALIGAQVVVNDDDIYWLERRTTDGPVTLFKAPK